MWLELVHCFEICIENFDYLSVCKCITGNLPMCRTNVPESRIILFPDIRHLFWSQATGSTATKNHGDLGNQDNSQKYDWFCHDLKAYYA